MIVQNVFFRSVLFFALIVLSYTGSAMAQQCQVSPEVILKLHKADIGAYAIWYGVHGDENHEERHASGVLLDGGNVVVAGMRGDLGSAYPDLIMSEVDRRGRVVWETKRSVKGLDRVLSSHRYGKDIVVSALITEGPAVTSFWVGIFDVKGALRTSRVFRRKTGSVVFGDIVPDANGESLAMVLSTQDKRSGVPRFSGFFKLNSKLQVLSKREFKPGPDNGIYDIVALQNGEYLLSGYIDNARGRKSGWVLRLSRDGGIMWQQQYPRGLGGEFLEAAEMPDGSFVAVGTALPAQEDAMKAGWVMNVDSNNGQTRWQRYFTGNIDYSAKDLLISKDGLISVMLEAKPVKRVDEEEGEKPRQYTRLVTLNPRGVIFDSQAYFQGEIANANAMFFGPARERIMVGYSQIAYQKDGAEISGDDKAADAQGPIVTRSDEGWIVAAPAMQAYEDPCKPKKPRVLDGL